MWLRWLYLKRIKTKPIASGIVYNQMNNNTTCDIIGILYQIEINLGSIGAGDQSTERRYFIITQFDFYKGLL